MELKQLLFMDEANYSNDLEEINRVSVRGIIFIDNKLLMIKTCFGEVKFPGGGQEKQENDCDTLIREVLEETGYHVIEESIIPFGKIIEKRLSTKENKIWHQNNHYYFCKVDLENHEATSFTDNEKRYYMQPILISLNDAINVNEKMMSEADLSPWKKREYLALKLIKSYLLDQNNFKPYDKCPVINTKHFTIRLLEQSDLEALQEVYSDQKAVPLFNSDNCNGDNFYYNTREKMQKAVDFWLECFYKWKAFIRFSIISKTEAKPIGTFEAFHMNNNDILLNQLLNHSCVIRLDLRSDYEKEDIIYELMNSVVPEFFAYFDVERLSTKCFINGNSRNKALSKIGYVSHDIAYKNSKGEPSTMPYLFLEREW